MTNTTLAQSRSRILYLLIPVSLKKGALILRSAAGIVKRQIVDR